MTLTDYFDVVPSGAPGVSMGRNAVRPVNFIQPGLSLRPSSDLTSRVRRPPSTRSAARRSSLRGVSTTRADGRDVKRVGATDTSSFVGKSVPGAVSIKKTPVRQGINLRGMDRFLGGASYWVPARADLDSPLSSIDAGLIADVAVVNGPYTSLLGPDFRFVDVAFAATPRYDCGSTHIEGSTLVDFKSNGEQWYGRQAFWGGGSDWGFRFSYGHRTGNDYATGSSAFDAGGSIPTSYKSRDLSFSFGFDLSEDSSLEFTYIRLDQTDVEFPQYLFDMDFLTTDAYEVTYSAENQGSYDRLNLSAWYNRTRFAGDSFRPGKQLHLGASHLPVTTDVHSLSTGGEAHVSWGDEYTGMLTLGSDFRFLNQELNDFDIVGGMLHSNYPIPDSDWVNPGLLAELSLPVNSELTVRTGGRLDWVSTTAANNPAMLAGPDTTTILEAGLDQNFQLWSSFLTGDYELSPDWTLHGGVGFAQRAPTLTQLYAVDSFLSLVQPGLTTVFGDPTLKPERLTQIDVGISGQFCCWDLKLSGYYSWIRDYITFDETIGSINPAHRSLAFVNTDRAVLAGAEFQAQREWSEYLVGFVNASYVEGRDLTRLKASRNRFFSAAHATRSDHLDAIEALPGLPPLETRLGLRIRERAVDPRWMVEFEARVVDDQDRTAETLGEFRTSGFTIYNIRSIIQASERVLVVAGVDNLTDKFYREHLDIRAGRGIYQPGITFHFATEVTY